jgi:hypothetical protein
MIKRGSKVKFLFLSFLNIARQLTNIISICLDAYMRKKILSKAIYPDEFALILNILEKEK